MTPPFVWEDIPALSEPGAHTFAFDITPILADERHAAISSTVHRNSRPGRNGVGAQLTETGALIVPATFTVVAPTLGAIPALRGG